MVAMAIQGQTYQWTSSAGARMSVYSTSAYDDRVVNICSDRAGNTYVGVLMDGYKDVMFGDESIDVPQARGVCSGILCYDCQGELLWYKYFFATTHSGVPVASLKTLNLLQDTILLVGMFRYTYDNLMVVNERGEIDTIHTDGKNSLLWINSKTQTISNIQQMGGNVRVEDNMIYNLNANEDILVSVYDQQGNALYTTTLDVSQVREGGLRLSMEWHPYKDKYYVFMTSTYPPIIGGDTLQGSRSYLACFDSSGANLWYRQWEGEIYHDVSFDIDTIHGTLYIAQGSRFAAYRLDGGLLFVRHIGSGMLFGVKVLSHHRVAVGGNATGYVSAGGVDNDTVGGPFFFLYDGNVDKFILCQRATSGVFTHFCVDKDDNLLFGGYITAGRTSILGDDTIRCRSDKRNTFFGKYGWPCGEAAQWPDAVGIEGVSSAAPQALTVYPNPTSDGVWVERFGTEAAALSVNAESVRLVLRGSMGRQVAQHILPAGTSRYYLPMAHLPQGIYLLEYHPQGQPPIVKKIVVL